MFESIKIWDMIMLQSLPNDWEIEEERTDDATSKSTSLAKVCWFSDQSYSFLEKSFEYMHTRNCLIYTSAE